jgi:hypothetical protein
MPGVSGVTVVTNACAFYHCARGCGRAERPAFPAPLLGQHSPSVFRGVKDFAQLGRIAPRDRGGASCHHSVFDFLSSFRDAPLGAVVVIDSGLARSLSSGRALRGPVGAPRNDDLPFQYPRPVFRGYDVHDSQRRASRRHIPSRLTEYFGACQGCSERPEKSRDETPAERHIEYQGQSLYRRDLRTSDPACTR